MANENCPECGQPDNCGDCDHAGGIISVNLDGNETAKLMVHERVYSDLSAYQAESGWTCLDYNGTKYFVSESGNVWKQPENRVVGVAPAIVQRCNEMEIQWEKHYIG